MRFCIVHGVVCHYPETIRMTKHGYHDRCQGFEEDRCAPFATAKESMIGIMGMQRIWISELEHRRDEATTWAENSALEKVFEQNYARTHKYLADRLYRFQ